MTYPVAYRDRARTQTTAPRAPRRLSSPQVQRRFLSPAYYNTPFRRVPFDRRFGTRGLPRPSTRGRILRRGFATVLRRAVPGGALIYFAGTEIAEILGRDEASLDPSGLIGYQGAWRYSHTCKSGPVEGLQTYKCGADPSTDCSIIHEEKCFDLQAWSNVDPNNIASNQNVAIFWQISGINENRMRSAITFYRDRPKTSNDRLGYGPIGGARLGPVPQPEYSLSPTDSTDFGYRLRPETPSPQPEPQREIKVETDADGKLDKGPPPDGLPKTPEKGEKERKVIAQINRRSGLGLALNLLTEGKDVIDAFWDALPQRYQTRVGGRVTTPTVKLQDLYRHWNEVNMDVALQNLVENQIEDAIFGAIGRLTGRAARVTGHRGFQGGPAI